VQFAGEGDVEPQEVDEFAGGIDLGLLDPDRPVEELEIEGVQGYIRYFEEANPGQKARVRDLGHALAYNTRIIGTPEQIVTSLEAWRDAGIGGPNAEFCLALGLALRGAPGIWGLACDTDGVDGAAEVAGAVVRPDLLARALRIGRNPDLALARNDSHGFFAALGDQVVTGPTLTNVNDFRALLIQPA